jgi:hypothetical protein
VTNFKLLSCNSSLEPAENRKNFITAASLVAIRIVCLAKTCLYRYIKGFGLFLEEHVDLKGKKKKKSLPNPESSDWIQGGWWRVEFLARTKNFFLATKYSSAWISTLAHNDFVKLRRRTDRRQIVAISACQPVTTFRTRSCNYNPARGLHLRAVLLRPGISWLDDFQGFRREADEICGLLGNCVSYSGNFWLTFRDWWAIPKHRWITAIRCVISQTRADLMSFNPLNAELNPICPLLTLLGAHHILHVSR